MANNRENLGSNNTDLSILDLDAIGAEWNLDASEIDTSGPIKRFAVGFKRGFKDNIKPTTFLAKTLRSALPDSYSRTISAGSMVKEVSKTIADEIKRTNASDLELIAEQVEKALPHLRNRTPDKIYSKVENRLSKIKQELRDVRHAQMRSSTPSVNNDEILLKELLGDMTATQVDLASIQEKNEGVRFDKERAERAIRDKVTGVRFNVLQKHIGGLTQLVERQVAFQDQITYKFQRKSLEAQYRSLFMLRDIRRMTEASVDMHKKAYDALIHNTALPDHQKTTLASRLKFSAEDSFTNNLSNKIAESLPAFLSNFYPAIIQNVTKGLQGAVSNMGSSIGGIGLLDIFGENKAGGIGQAIGGGVSGKIQKELSAALASRLKPLLGKASDKLGGQHHRLDYILNNAPSLLREYTTDLNQSVGWRGKIQEMVRSAVPTFYQNSEVTGGAYNTMDKQVGFTQLTQRSIVEVIPGYLSRILHEVRMARTGDNSIEREVYDITAGRFTGYSEAKGALLNRVILPQTRRYIGNTLDELVASMDAGGTLSDEAKHALRERLMRDVMSGGRFDPKRYAEGGYGEKTSESVLNELGALFKGQYSFDEKGDMLNSPENYKRLNALNPLFTTLQNLTPEVRKELSRLSGAGSQELLRDLGLMRSEYGRDYVNYDQLYSQLSKGDDNKITDVYRDQHGVQLVLKATDIESGKYIDEESGKRIRSFDDITGPIRDELGRVVLTASEVTQELYTQSGVSVRFRSVLDKFKQAGKFVRGGIGGGIGFIHKTILSLADKMGDLYIKGKDQAVLLARDIRLGHYIDVNTQKIIRNINDITGAVVDLSGNIVITATEFAEGLVDATGSPPSAVWSKVNRYLDITTTPAKAVLGFLKRGVVTAATTLWRGIVKQVDAYIAGEETPRIMMNKLRNGFYLDAKTNKVIRTLDDIKGAVVDINGNMIISDEEVTQLVDRNGEKHPIAKRRGLLYRATFGLAKKALGATGRFAAGYWKAVAKPYYKWLGGKVLPKWMTGGKEDAKELKEMGPTDGILARILGVLDSRLPGGTLRKGSWQEILANRKNKDKTTGTAVNDEKERKNPFSSITSSLAKMFGLSKDREEDDEDGGDINVGGVDLGGDGKKKGGKVRGKKPKIPKGKLGRAWAGTKKFGGKALSGVKRLLGPLARFMIPAATLAGGAITSAASAVGGALTTAGAAIAGILSAPVVIGAAIVAGAAVGGYMYYQKRQATKGPFRELRLAQYGVSPKGWSNAAKVLEIENLFEAITSKGPGYPTLDLQRLDLQKIVDIVGVDDDDEEEINVLTAWIGERFRPVYLAYRGALGNIAPDVPLAELDDKLPPELGLRLLELVTFPYSGNTPYLVTANPFDGWTSFSIDIDDIKDYEAEVRAKYAKFGKDDKEAATPANSAAGKIASAGAVSMAGNNKSAVAGGIHLKSIDVSELTGGSGNVVSIASKATLTQALFGSELTSLEAIRLKTYGSERLLMGEVRALFTLEERLSKRIVIDPTGTAQFNGSFESLANEYGNLFGVAADPTSPKYTEFVTWLRLRFMPVYLNTLSVVKRIKPNAMLTMSLTAIEKTMSAPEKVTLGNAIVGSTVDYQGESLSVWKINETPFGLVQNPTSLEASARAYVRLLEQEALSTAMKPPSITSGTQTPASNILPFRTNGTTGAGSSRQYNAASLKAVGLGNQLSTFGDGKGGVWQEVPYPKANKSREAAMVTLSVVGEMTGVSPSLLGTIVSIESSFNYSIKASTSSASGWFQFINSTWDMMVKNYGSQYGFPNDPTRTLRLDPRANALMGAEFTKENYNALLKAINRPPTDTDVYLAHFFGVSAAIKFLNADPNATAAQLFPEAAKANVSIFYTLGGHARTVGEVYQLMDEKVSRHRVGDVGVNTSTRANSTAALIEAPPSMPSSSDQVIKPAGYTNIADITKRSVAQPVASPHHTPVGASPFAAMALPKEDVTSAVEQNTNTPKTMAQRQQVNAQAQDRVQRQVVDVTMSTSKEIMGVLEKQLAVQVKMRDYLEEIASKIGGLGGSNNQSSSRPDYSGGKTQPPISMRK